VASAGAAAERPPVGEMLRRARAARGETVGDVAHTLKLAQRQIEAMESGRFELLPGPAFVRGFVRNYGRHLGLDQATLMAALEHEIATPAVELVPVSNADGIMPSGGNARPAHRPAAAVVVVLIVAMLAGWYFDWFEAPERSVTTDVVEPAGTALAPTPQPLPDEADGEAAPDRGAEFLAAPSAPAGSDFAVPPPAPPAGSAPASPVAPLPAPPLPESAPAPAPSASAPAPEVAVAPEQEQLRFRLQGESWIEVRDGGGGILFSGVAPAGSTRTVQGRPPFAVVVGNAPQVAIEYRGRPVDLAPHTRVGIARLSVQ